jgi:hypothetical protein
MHNEANPSPRDSGPDPEPEIYLRGVSLLLPPAVIAAYPGNMFLTGRGPRGQAEEQVCRWCFGLSPFLAVYILVALFFLGKRQCPKWLKVIEVILALIILFPLVLSSFYILILCLAGLGPQTGPP